MTAYYAAKSRADISKLEDEMQLLMNAIAADQSVCDKLSKECNVYSITARLNHAIQLLHDYDGMLDTALRNTELKEVAGK